MMDVADLKLLNRMLVREASSLLQYLGGAWPWVSEREQPILSRLRTLQTEEARAIRKLAEFLLKHRGTPGGPVFPEEFTTLHFVGLDHLLPRLVAFQRWLVHEAGQNLDNLKDPIARSFCEPLLAMNRQHLAELERLSSQETEAGSASTRR
jgi:hypothetical protein